MALSRPVPFSVLDLAPIAAGSTPGQALGHSVDLARRAEGWGYRRLWVAEHHNMPGIASSAPAVLIAHLAAATELLRLGSGGVMLPNHAPLVVAEQFGMLEAIHPGRIDLGIGRAPGTDRATAAALRRSPGPISADDFPQQLGELLAFFHGSFPEDHPYRAIQAVPGQGDVPEVWLLGSSGYSAQVAGLLGLPFAFAHHFSPANTLPALALYRDRFEPSAALAEPYAMVGVAVLAADTDEEAVFLHGSSRLQMLRLRTGRPGPVPPPEEAAAYLPSPQEAEIVRAATGSHVVGSPATVAGGLDDLLAATGADELMVTTTAFDHKSRLHSFELVADLAGLPAPA
ncbi:MAG: LLM class flavin-dependent oxidoreductase [Acidimicrobiales bacterium]